MSRGRQQSFLAGFPLLSSATHQNNLAFHRPRHQKLNGLPSFEKLKGAADQRIDLLFRKEREDFWQVLMQRPGVFTIQGSDAVKVATPSPQTRTQEEIAEHGEFGKHSFCTHETKTDDQSSPAQRADAGANVASAHGVENVVHTFGFESTRKAVERPGAVVDGRRSE